MRRWSVVSCVVFVATCFLSEPAGAVTPWSWVSSPNRGTQNNELFDAAALGADDVWAVGEGSSQPLIEHWDGASWSVVPSPSFLGGGTLQGVDGISPSDVWAVGGRQATSEHNGSAIVERWDGHDWSVQSIGPAGRELTDVSAISSSNVWVTARKWDALGNQYVYVMRWNGSRWRTVWKSSANPDMAVGVDSLVALSRSDVWWVGTWDSTSGTSARAYHWDGGTVTEASPSPVMGEQMHELTAVGASSPSNVWAVGDWVGGFQTSWATGGYAARFNGTAWLTKLPPAYTDGTSHRFNAVAPASSTDVWAVGERGAPASTTAGFNLMEHWNGSRWSEYGGPNPGSDFNRLSEVVHVPGTSTFWAVGTWKDDAGPFRTLVVRCCA